MKRYIIYTALIIAISACVKSDVDPEFLRIGDKEANLYDGFYHDFGTNEDDISYRMYGVQLMDNDHDPSYYIRFLVYSFSTRELIEGSYSYNFEGGEGTFSYLKAGAALKRDSDGFYVEGEVYNDSHGVKVLKGYVDIARDRSKYTFDIFATVVKNNDTIDIEAYYNGYLQEQYIDIFEEEE